MIRLLNDADLRILDRVLKDDPRGVTIGALAAAYGFGLPFLDFWEQDGYQAVIMRLDRTYLIDISGEPDWEELVSFFSLSPYLDTLRGEWNAVSRISLGLNSGSTLDRCRLLRLNRLVPAKAADVDYRPDLQKVYSILLSANGEFSSGGFAPWYVDLSHRIRHGCAKAALLTDGQPVSACLVSAETGQFGFLNGVGTLSQFTGRGYASSLVSAVCAALLESGKTPLLECGENLENFYARLGFERIGETGVLKTNNE